MTLEAALKKYFNYATFRIGQKEVIQSVLSGRDTLAMLPTGTGKSLCYQLPGYLLPGHVLIVSPLLSLMQDQVDQLMSQGEKRVIAINSFLTSTERQRVFSQLKYYKFIFISPEMLQVSSVIAKIKLLSISLFVVDEAHCISQWGYDFRFDYQRLGDIRNQLQMPTTLALTATATEEVRTDICQTLLMNDAFSYIASVDRANIALFVEKLQGQQQKLHRLEALVRSLSPPGIIYFSSKKQAEQVATLLTKKGIQGVAFYHGGMDTEQRILIQQQFIHDQLQIICATSAFGMGLNKQDVRFVLHFHPPLQLESYIQEIGRAGRDGHASIAILLNSPEDEYYQYQLAESEFPSNEQVDMLVALLQASQQHLTINEVQQVCVLSDNQWQFIQRFLNQKKIDKSKAQILKRYIRKRKQLKRQKVVEMNRFISTKKCRRINILNYFAETRKIDVEQCCDNCGLKISDFEINPIHATNKQQYHQEKTESWQLILQSLLKVEVNRRNKK